MRSTASRHGVYLKRSHNIDAKEDHGMDLRRGRKQRCSLDGFHIACRAQPSCKGVRGRLIVGLLQDIGEVTLTHGKSL